jgi:hypothetical protein
MEIELYVQMNRTGVPAVTMRGSKVVGPPASLPESAERDNLSYSARNANED